MTHIVFEQACGVPDNRLAANVRYARSLGLPYLAASEIGRGPLDIVGRGPSAAQFRYDGHDIWACGSAVSWCIARGIHATALCVDPQPAMAAHMRNVRHAIVADLCDPMVFDMLKGADVRLINPEEIAHGTTAATFALELGVTQGHGKIYFHGCESSFGTTTHADGDLKSPHLLRVECGGELFLTNPQMLIQAREMWEMFATHPDIFIDKSGGLLGAMIKARGVHDVVAATPAFQATLRPMIPSEGMMGLTIGEMT